MATGTSSVSQIPATLSLGRLLFTGSAPNLPDRQPAGAGAGLLRIAGSTSVIFEATYQFVGVSSGTNTPGVTGVPIATLSFLSPDALLEDLSLVPDAELTYSVPLATVAEDPVPDATVEVNP